jgi:hypothetical protein
MRLTEEAALADGSPGEAGPAPMEALSVVVARLRNELDGLRRAMRSRAVIEQAKGVLIERMGIGSDDAFEHLVRLSQRTNVKLVEVSASLVGTRVPDPSGPGAGERLDDELREYLSAVRASTAGSGEVPGGVSGAAELAVRKPALEALQSQHQLLTVRISTARTFDEVAETICDVSTGWPKPAVASIYLLEPDGALRLVGAVGLSTEARSQWARVPPIPELPIVVAAHGHIPVYLGDSDLVASRFPLRATLPLPSECVVAIPLSDGDRVIGVVGTAWDVPVELTDEVRKYMYALAAPCARRCVELTAIESTMDGDAESADRAWPPLELPLVEVLAVRGLCLSVGDQVHRPWYDVVTLPDSSILLVVGEVTGAGAGSAATGSAATGSAATGSAATGSAATGTAGRLRHTVPAYGLLGMTPAEILGAVNQLLCQFEPERVATLVVARYTPDTRELRWAAAGQVAPICYHADRSATVLSGPLGLPVGAAEGIAYHDTTVTLHTDDRLLLYTDGLVSRRTSTFADGLNVLLRSDADTSDLRGLVEHVNAALGGPPDVEACLLVARVTR